jgi:hypothetical protein
MIGPEIALPLSLPNRVREIFLTIVFNHGHSPWSIVYYPEPNLRSDRLVAEPHLGRCGDSKFEIPKTSEIEPGTSLKIYPDKTPRRQRYISRYLAAFALLRRHSGHALREIFRVMVATLPR